MTSLYLCYQSLLDPLTQTQVVAYLRGLTQAGYRLILLTFEPHDADADELDNMRDALAVEGIIWHQCRYHKRPRVPATAWDVLAGIRKGRALVRQYDVKLIHARSHVPGLMALGIRRQCDVKFLFDIRGFLAEEYADAGLWPADGRLFRMTKRVERRIVAAADGFVVLTQWAAEQLQAWYPAAIADKPLEVIPCCVDQGGVAQDGAEQSDADDATRLVYVGKLGGWYMLEPMFEFVSEAATILPNASWHIWTQSDTTDLRRLIDGSPLADRITVGRTTPEELPRHIETADAGLSFVLPSFSKKSSSPTKIGEYLAAGLPVVSTAGIGDVDQLLVGSNGTSLPVGVLLDQFDAAGYRRAAQDLAGLLADPHIKQRCRDRAASQLHLQDIGWRRYGRLYAELIGTPTTNETMQKGDT